MEKLLIRSSTSKSIAFIVILLVGPVYTTTAAYAHTFTGDESASLLSVIKILEAEGVLVQTNLTSNLTLAQEHAKAVVGIVSGNHTFGVLPNEVSENNKRVAANIVSSASAVQTAVNSTTAPTQADVKAKIDNFNATLQEAVAVRIPKDHVNNATINGEATKNLANETLRQYGYALGISSGKEGNTSAPAIFADAASHNSVVNMSAYQSAQALASQAQEMVTQTKTLLPSNKTSATTSIIFKVANDLSQLENTIETKSPYAKVSSLVQDDLSGSRCSVPYEIKVKKL